MLSQYWLCVFGVFINVVLNTIVCDATMHYTTSSFNAIKDSRVIFHVMGLEYSYVLEIEPV